jgi:hypothetical protein
MSEEHITIDREVASEASALGGTGAGGDSLLDVNDRAKRQEECNHILSARGRWGFEVNNGCCSGAGGDRTWTSSPGVRGGQPSTVHPLRGAQPALYFQSNVRVRGLDQQWLAGAVQQPFGIELDDCSRCCNRILQPHEGMRCSFDADTIDSIPGKELR